ncbi:MAG: hypothetical protein R3F19_23835 [Verrucomicrobiales bacterium]
MSFVVRALCLIVLLPLSAVYSQDAWYRVEGILESGEEQLNGVRLLVPWASVDSAGGKINVRVVFRNVKREAVGAFGLMAADDYVLTLADGQRLPAKAKSESLALVVPSGGLAPTQSNSGMLAFSAPVGSEFKGPAVLEVSRFGRAGFDISPSRAFVPPPVGKLLPVNQVLRSNHDAMALVVLEVDSAMVTKDGKLVVSLGFRNTGRADLKISTRLTGGDARIADGELNVSAPDAVSPALEHGITPKSSILAAGTPHNGTVRFPLSHPVAAEQWQFFYPGYERLGAQWNSSKGRFDVKVMASESNEPASETTATDGGGLAAEDRRFRGIESLLKRLQGLITAGDTDAYLASLPLHLRESHGRLLRDAKKVNATGLTFDLPPLQRFEQGPDGSVPEVQVLLHYALHDGEKLNRMTASAVARFAEDGGQWRIADLRFVKAAPFWLLGYVSSEQTDHFTIYYRAASESADKIGKAGRQMEKAYRELKRKGIPVEEKSVAIFLDQAEDFAAVAGIDADRFDGAAMFQYQKTGDQFEVRNRLVYINDTRFVTGERLWGMQDRQSTITHELVHLYLSKDTRPWIPSWVVEGIAIHFADQHNSWSRRALRQNPYFEKISLSELSKKHTLTEGNDARATQAAYLLSGEAFSQLDKKAKGQKLLDFFRSYSGYDFTSIRTALVASGVKLAPDESPSIATAGPVLTEILLRQHFGLSLATLDADAKETVRKRGF